MNDIMMLINLILTVFSALVLFVGHQERHLVCNTSLH